MTAHPDDAMARFELGCVLTAEGNWTTAMQRCVEDAILGISRWI